MDKEENKQEDITEKDVYSLIDDIGYTKEEIIKQIQDQYNESIQFTRLKREIFKRRDKLNVGIKDQQDKVYVRLVYATVDTLNALEYSDERSVIFNGRQVGTQDYADNVNNVAKYDYEQMGCEMKKLQVRHDKYMRGVGIEVMDKWDSLLHNPEYKVIDPMVYCPDWFGNVNTWPRYHWFEFQAIRADLEADENYFDIDDCMTTDQLNTLAAETQDNIRTERGLNNVVQTYKSDILNIYYHYFKLWNRPYLAVLWNDKTKLIRFEQLPAITDIEKKDPSKIPFPIVLRHYRPVRYDPFGISVPDLLEDKEAMQQLFINLSRIKAEHEALWDLFLFDPDKVDVNNLTIPTIWPKYIPVTWMASIQGGAVAMQEVPKWQIKNDAQMMPDIIRNEGMLWIGMDNQTLWVQWQSNITATENQRVQGNANLRLMLGIKLDNYAEKQFWGLWYRFYLYYFNTGKVKNFALNDSIGRVYYSIKKSDFGWLTDIDIEIKSKTDVEAQKEKEKVGFMAVVMNTLANPNLKQSQRAFLERELYRLNWVPEEKINLYVAMPDEERNAKEHLALLNNNEMPPKISNLDEDHWAYIVIYDRALNTDAKWKAIERRKLAMQMSWQTSPTPLPQQEGNQAMGNMMTNNMLQQSNKQWASSLQSIKQ